MKRGIILLSVIALAIFVMVIRGCSESEGDFTGREYMPDMAHSVAYESNLSSYYSLNHFSDDTTYHKMVMPRLPVANTIPRGAVGVASGNGDATTESMRGYSMNGSVPYYYENTEADRAKAIAEIKKNPYELTDAGLAQGKELYNIYCGVCHGDKADGNGYLVRDNGGKYPAQPSNLTSDEYKNASEGRFYHTIMHGKGVMGSYADKLSYEERWQVIHYIRKMQFGDEYDPLAATASFDSSTVTTIIEEVVVTGNASNAALVLDKVFFETGKAVLEAGSKSQLDVLASILKENSEVSIQINGHTDNVGDAAKNLSLSEERAKAVLKYLTDHGIDASRMSAKGFGDTKPTADNDSPDGRQKNRRTDFNVLSN